jgi:molecular chaperone GrpE
MENDVTKQNNDEQQLIGDEQELEEVDLQGNGVDAEPEGDEFETVRAERDRYLDQWQRAAADFANYRRRNEQERAQVVSMVRKDVLAQFLPVIDDFERALGLIPADEQSTGWVKGLEMIDTKFRGILERVDARIIDPIGEPFDPSQHEAVATEPGTTGSTVVEVYQKGYAIGDHLVRPAMVKTGDTVKTDA